MKILIYLLVPKFRGRIPPYLPQNEIGENAMRRMYTNIIRMDKGVGKILDQLEEDGLIDKTIVVCSSDHGGPLRAKNVYFMILGLGCHLLFATQMDLVQVDDRLISLSIFLNPFIYGRHKAPIYMEGQALKEHLIQIPQNFYPWSC